MEPFLHCHEDQEEGDASRPSSCCSMVLKVPSAFFFPGQGNSILGGLVVVYFMSIRPVSP